MFHLLKIF